MRILFTLLLISLGTLLGCYYSYKYPIGRFPTNVVNLKEVNSQYNDFNLSAPEIYSRHHLCFSSDRNSQGVEFDIVEENIAFVWDKNDGSFKTEEECTGDTYFPNVLEKIKSSENEFGPFLIFNEFNKFVTIFSRESEGKLNSYVLTATDTSGPYEYEPMWCFDTIKPISAVNSEHSDGYVSFYHREFNPQYEHLQYATSLHYCSDRDGQFDLYEIPIEDSTKFLEVLTDENAVSNKLEVLSSAGNDKCPYTSGEVMVFTSDREGGYGGFDLYYSIRKGDSWSEPINFGDKVNSEYDEYRPIFSNEFDFENQVLMFSSNRPGGFGGFDLYYVGVDIL